MICIHIIMFIPTTMYEKYKIASLYLMYPILYNNNNNNNNNIGAWCYRLQGKMVL